MDTSHPMQRQILRMTFINCLDSERLPNNKKAENRSIIHQTKIRKNTIIATTQSGSKPFILNFGPLSISFWLSETGLYRI